MDLPELARDTTADQPWPVRLLSAKIEDYIARMSTVWVEGQVVQLSRRPGSGMAFLTLRDTEINESLSVSIYSRILEAGPAINEGDQVVVRAKATFWRTRGSLQLQADKIRPVGVGDLLARIENLKRVLAGEGLFDADRKRPLPFLPRVVGLVCGRESKAEHDVRVNAAVRWPSVVFATRQVAVQGAQAVAQVSAAIEELDAMADVDVIVVARGGGSVEDLLPFSNEALVRVAANCRTPLVSAIGHETDTPLLDLVADFRASTPTDAAKRIVPDLADELRGLARARERLGELVNRRLDREREGLAALRARPALAHPETLYDAQAQRLAAATDRLRTQLDSRLAKAERDVTALATGVHALSPALTLERGYAIVQGADGAILRDSASIEVGDEFFARLATGTLTAAVTATNENPPSTSG